MRKMLILSLLLVLACAAPEKQQQPAAAAPAAPPPPPAPSATEAKTLVANSQSFSEYQFTNAAYSLPMQKSAMNAPARAAAAALVKGGWIRMSGDEVVLTEKGTSDRRILVRANGFIDLVPLARKDLGEVTAVRPLPDGSLAVDFGWKWIANELGTAVAKERYEGPQKATATLIVEGGGWTVLKVEPAA